MSNLAIARNQLANLKGANVRMFGQPARLSEEFGELTIDTLDVIDSLMSYEVTDLTLEIYHDENDYHEEIENDSIERYLEHMDGLYGLKETKSDNTYNWASPVTHDFYFHVYENRELDNVLIEIAFHLYGDVRGNYTTSALLEFQSLDHFLEVLLENNKYIEHENYRIEVDIFSDNCEVYTNEGQFLGTIVDLEDINDFRVS